MFHFWHSLRWFLRRRLGRVHSNSKVVIAEASTLLYLFAGTYGDFVQILRPLEKLASVAPKATIYLLAPPKIAKAFKAFLPDSVEIVGWRRAWLLSFRGIEVLLTNAVGVYRVRFDLLASLSGKISLGFRHPEEKKRGAYTATLPLTPAIKNFETANLALLRLAGISSATSATLPAWKPKDATEETVKTNRWLFHVGSAGLLRKMGMPKYSSIIREILLQSSGNIEEIIYGPGDEKIVAMLRGEFPSLRYSCPDLGRLANQLQAHPGNVLCFNSFLAHFCRYLGVPAKVIHFGKVPYGYDCEPLHFQYVLGEDGVVDSKIISYNLRHRGFFESPPLVPGP